MIVKVLVPFKYCNTKTGNLVDANIGDEISDFDNWPYVCQKAHLDLNWVVKIEESPAKEIVSEKRGVGRPPKK